MPFTKSVAMFAALALLSACDARFGKEADKGEAAPAAAPAAAEGKAKEGQFSINAPGFDMKIDLPQGVTSHGDSDSDLLYPGSTLSGMHIEGSRGTGEGKGNAGIELRFKTPDALEKVAAWYRDPARAAAFAVRGVTQEGGALVMTGAEKQDGDPFKLRLRPASGGGTEGSLILTDQG